MIALEIILVYLILIPFILLNIAIIIGTFLESKVANFAIKILKLKEGFEEEPSKKFKLFYTLVWILAGIIGDLSLPQPISLDGFMVLIAFRGGANLGTRVIFGLHDTRLVKEATSDSSIIRLVSIAFQMGLAVEALFLLAWGLLYKFLYLTVRTAFGVSANTLMVVLWISGLIFGILLATIRSRGTEGFLLRDEIGIVLLLSGKLLEEKIKEKTKFLPW